MIEWAAPRAHLLASVGQQTGNFHGFITGKAELLRASLQEGHRVQRNRPSALGKAREGFRRGTVTARPVRSLLLFTSSLAASAGRHSGKPKR